MGTCWRGWPMSESWRCPRCGTQPNYGNKCVLCRRPKDPPPGWEIPEQ